MLLFWDRVGNWPGPWYQLSDTMYSGFGNALTVHVDLLSLVKNEEKKEKFPIQRTQPREAPLQNMMLDIGKWNVTCNARSEILELTCFYSIE